MREESKHSLEPGPAHIRDAAQRVLDHFIEQLVDCASQNDGILSASALEAQVKTFVPLDSPEYSKVFNDVWQGCYAIAESAHWAKARHSHFERIMVKCFADLLPRSNEPLSPDRHLSRRIIPCFINALQQMMGQELYSQHSDRVDALVETMRAVHGDAFSWDDVYDDAICLAVVEDVLIGVSQHFPDMAKRRNWMIDVIAGQMPSASDEAEKEWYFGDAAFHTLMNALYGPLRQRYLDVEDRTGLADRYGESEINNLSTLFAGLAADHADLTQAGRI